MNKNIESIDILLVDDNKELLEINSEILKLKGYSVTLIDDPDKVLPYVQKHNIKIIICDNDLGKGKLTGYELLKEIKNKNKDIILGQLSGNPSYNELHDVVDVIGVKGEVTILDLADFLNKQQKTLYNGSLLHSNVTLLIKEQKWFYKSKGIIFPCKLDYKTIENLLNEQEERKYQKKRQNDEIPKTNPALSPIY